MRTVELTGTICAGKMSLLEGVRRRLAILDPDYTVKVIAQDLVIQSEMAHPKDYFERQVLLTNDVTNRLIKFRDLRMPMLVLVHRGLYDSQSFLSAYVKAGFVPHERASPQFAAWEANADSLTDLVVLVKTPVRIAFQRMKKKFSTLFELEDRDIVLNKEFFKILDEAYNDLERKLPSNSVIVDGNDLVEVNVKKLLRRIKRLLKEERDDFGRNNTVLNKKGDLLWESQKIKRQITRSGLRRKEAVSV